MRMAKRLFPLLLLPFVSVAMAEPVRYDFGGTCAWGCGGAGMADGAVVSGFLVAADGFAADGILESSELVEFGFAFGSRAIRSGFGEVSDGTMNVGADLGLTGRLLFAEVPTWFVEIGEVGDDSSGYYQGWRLVQRFGDFENMYPLAGGPGSLTPRTSVPEPGSAALLGLALAGIASARRRKESGRG